MSIATAITAAQGRVANAYTAISNKGGTLPATQNLANMPTAIASIPGGGGSPTINSLSITPSTSAQTYTASGGVDGYSPVSVSAVTSSIDPNITAGNIKNGVSILGVTGNYSGTTPSGTINITQNGTYNVTNYASANVSVSGGGTVDNYKILKAKSWDVTTNTLGITLTNVYVIIDVTDTSYICGAFFNCDPPFYNLGMYAGDLESVYPYEEGSELVFDFFNVFSVYYPQDPDHYIQLDKVRCDL